MVGDLMVRGILSESICNTEVVTLAELRKQVPVRSFHNVLSVPAKVIAAMNMFFTFSLLAQASVQIPNDEQSAVDKYTVHMLLQIFVKGELFVRWSQIVWREY